MGEDLRAVHVSLFPPPESVARRSRLNHALEEISERFGPRKVVLGGAEETERAGLSFQIKRGTSDRSYPRKPDSPE